PRPRRLGSVAPPPPHRDRRAPRRARLNDAGRREGRPGASDAWKDYQAGVAAGSCAWASAAGAGWAGAGAGAGAGASAGGGGAGVAAGAGVSAGGAIVSGVLSAGGSSLTGAGVVGTGRPSG